MRKPLRALPLVLALLSASAARPGDAPGDGAPGFADVGSIALADLDGRHARLADLAGTSATVVAYTGVGCPIAGKYAPRLARLSERYAERGVRFVGINASPQDSAQAIREERSELGIGFPVLKDARQVLTRALGATTTTQVFVFDAQGALRYRGAVDDQYDLGAGKPQPSRTYLTDALDALLAGKEPPATETAAPGCKLTVLPPEELPEAVTWSEHVARVFQKNCETCHRPGQVGPFALQTYEQARGWAEMIASVVDEGRMPPWNAHPRYDGVFANERRLSATEKDTIQRWVADGMPEGDPSKAPAPVEWPVGWTIGEPDVVFEMETVLGRRGKPSEPLPEPGFEVPREGVVDYEYFTTRTSFPEDRWVRAYEVVPGAADVVHHVLILTRDADDEGRVRLSDDAFKSFFAAAVPGETSAVYPEGYGKRLPAGATLVFQLHYTPNGKQRFDRSRVGLIFCDELPIFEVVTDAVVNDEFRIPPGAASHEVRGTTTLFEDTGVVAFLPHMHTRGKDFRFVAHYPDGSEEELLFTDYDFNWQESYVLYDPLPLPPGTRLECIGHFDNSADNPNNPDPTEWVEWGDQTFEEMFIGYYDYVRPLE